MNNGVGGRAEKVCVSIQPVRTAYRTVSLINTHTHTHNEASKRLMKAFRHRQMRLKATVFCRAPVS